MEYQKEVGLNLDPHVIRSHQTQKTEERLDSLQEAREMLPKAKFYKIVRKDRIAVIDDYYDRCPLLGFRKQIMKARVYCQRTA